MFALLKVYLVNRIIWPFSCVNNNNIVLMANDLPLPLPPVTIKYLESDSPQTKNLLFIFNCTYQFFKINAYLIRVYINRLVFLVSPFFSFCF